MDPSYDVLLVGLGNPGPQYARTRHNMGWLVLDDIHLQNKCSAWGWTEKGLVSSGKIENKNVMLLKPTTMMNLSGEAVIGVIATVSIAVARIIVIHDELDIPFADVRTKFSGGDAGHRGVRDVVRAVSTKDFHRVRCGIGHPGTGDKVLDYVLSEFSNEEQESLPGMICEATVLVREIMSKIDENS